MVGGTVPRERRSRTVAAVGVLLVAAMLPLSSCATYHATWVSFGGKVRDLHGGAVEGAELSIVIDGAAVSERPVAVTNGSGRYQLLQNSCPCRFRFELLVSRNGYEDLRLSLPGQTANRLARLDLVLQPAGTRAVSPAAAH